MRYCRVKSRHLHLNTGRTYTLHKLPLCKEIKQDNGSDYHKCSGGKNGIGVSHGNGGLDTGISLDEGTQTFHDICKTGAYQTNVSEEHLGIESVCPLPYECKQETGSDDGLCFGKHDHEEGLEHSAAVNVRSFFHVRRDIPEELSDHVDIETVLKTHASKAHKVVGDNGTSEVNGTSRDELEYSQEIKESEMQEQRV